jgi:type IV pilus assembly protein PilV
MTYKLRQRAPGVPRRMQGVGLIEVLIAVLIMAIGLLGIAAMQATTLRNSQSSVERTQAVMQTYAILDAMRANLAAARNNSYNLAMTCTPPAGGTLITNDQRFWLQTVQTSLGAGSCGQITCASNSCAITVQWDDSRGTGDKSALTTQTLSTRTRI